jgi:hypothetical protein
MSLVLITLGYVHTSNHLDACSEVDGCSDVEAGSDVEASTPALGAMSPNDLRFS